MESKDIYIQCIYSQVKDAVEAFNRKLTQKLEAKPPKEKKKIIRKVKHGKFFVGAFQKEEDIPDEYFISFFDLPSLDVTITAEVEKYERILHLDYTQGNLDIKDVVSNPKTNGMTYIDSLNRLYDKTDSVDYYERTFQRHMANLKRNWLLFNDRRMCLWGSSFKKIGSKFYISNANGSHLTCLCKLIQISGLSDESLNMPSGFVESLKSIRTIYKNTTDDLEFVLMFNQMYDLMKVLYPDIEFYLREFTKKGENIIGIKGTDIEISSVSDMVKLLKAQPIRIGKGNQKPEITTNIVVNQKAVGEE